MKAIHDRGGWPGAGPIERTEHHLEDWERRTDAMMQILASPEKRVIRVDETRRAIESLDPEKYESLRYYEKWCSAIEMLMIEKKILTRDEIDRKVSELQKCGR
jgi:hypothetical protein